MRLLVGVLLCACMCVCVCVVHLTRVQLASGLSTCAGVYLSAFARLLLLLVLWRATRFVMCRCCLLCGVGVVLRCVADMCVLMCLSA